MLSSVLIALYAAMPGQAEQHAPEQGSDDAVGEVLRGRFDRGPGDAVRVQARRIAADDVRDRVAALVRVRAPDRRPPLRRARTGRAPRSGCSWPGRAAASRAAIARTAPARREQPPRSARSPAGWSSRPRRAWSAAGVAGSSQRPSSRAMIRPIPTTGCGEAPPEPSRVTEQGIDSQGKQQRAEQRRLGPSAAWQAAAPHRLWRRATGIAIQGGTGDG